MVRTTTHTALAIALLLCSSLPAAQQVKVKYFQTEAGQAALKQAAEARTYIDAIIKQQLKTQEEVIKKDASTQAHSIKVTLQEQEAKIQELLTQMGHQDHTQGKRAQLVRNLEKLSNGLTLTPPVQMTSRKTYSLPNGTLMQEDYVDVFRAKVDERNALIEKYARTERLAADARRTAQNYGIPCALVAALLYTKGAQYGAKVNWEKFFATVNMAVLLPMIYAVLRVPQTACASFIEHQKLQGELAQLDRAIAGVNEVLFPAWKEGDSVAQHLQSPCCPSMWELQRVCMSLPSPEYRLILEKMEELQIQMKNIQDFFDTNNDGVVENQEVANHQPLQVHVGNGNEETGYDCSKQF